MSVISMFSRTATAGVGLQLALIAGCMPPSVRAVDGWLEAYAREDAEGMVRYTTSDDRDLVRRAMEAQASDPTGALALMLPGRPITHELIEIESKAPGRHTILAVITLKNPLPYAAERLGQHLGDVPRMRTERRRFLSVQTDDRWGVKLDLRAALDRIEHVERFEAALMRGDFAAAQSMLSSIPPPPDEANALRNKDRLEESLRNRLQGARIQHIGAKTAQTTASELP